MINDRPFAMTDDCPFGSRHVSMGRKPNRNGAAEDAPVYEAQGMASCREKENKRNAGKILPFVNGEAMPCARYAMTKQDFLFDRNIRICVHTKPKAVSKRKAWICLSVREVHAPAGACSGCLPVILYKAPVLPNGSPADSRLKNPLKRKKPPRIGFLF